ncbi:hypothetical protein FQN55_004936 [Onygenales sp. PD_40]|nr:hypothetical protein FQN55_004936 [Onygenales sp. PD_40]
MRCILKKPLTPTMPNTWPFRDELVQEALDAARNAEDGQIDPRWRSILETAITEVWRKVQAQPDAYILTKEEFGLFNFFLDRFRGPIAQRAVERYWNNTPGPHPNPDEYALRNHR